MATKRTKTVVTETQLTTFNIMREKCQGEVFNRAEMIKLLKSAGFTAHNSLVSAFASGVNPPIVRIERGKYIFTKEPVYKDRLQLALDTYLCFVNPKRHTKDSKLTEEECIEFLKQTGKYEIYRVIKKLEKI
jgi:hypothetical protein